MAKPASVPNAAPISPDSLAARGLFGGRFRTTAAVILVATALILWALLAITWLGREADRQRVVENRLQELEVMLHRTNAAEWKAIAQHTPDLPSIREADRLRAGAGGLLKGLAGEPGVAAVSRAFGEYDGALLLELQALERGEDARARQIDEEQVDPAFERLRDAIARLAGDVGRQSGAASRRAGLYSAALLAGVALIAASVFGRARSHHSLRRVHALLRDRERSYRQLFEESLDPVFVVDTQGRIADANRAATVLTGDGKSGLTGSLFSALPFQPDGNGTFPVHPQRLLDGAEHQVRLRRRNGDLIDCLVSSTVRLDEDGTSIGHQVFVHDVTKRKRAEGALTRLGDRTAAILASAGEGILGLDLDGNHTFVSPTAAAMLGFEAEELVGTSSHAKWHHTKPDGRPCRDDECSIHAAYRDGTTRRRDDEVFWRKDGTSFPVEYVSTPLRERGVLTGAVVVFSDITERRRAEEEREQLVGELREALAHVKALRGILPICAWCKKVRDDEGYWHQVEVYVRDHSEAQFSHGICPSCMEREEARG